MIIEMGTNWITLAKHRQNFSEKTDNAKIKDKKINTWTFFAT